MIYQCKCTIASSRIAETCLWSSISLFQDIRRSICWTVFQYEYFSSLCKNKWHLSDDTKLF